MTARDLITRSLRLIGILASGEAAEASMTSDALISMNSVIDSWKNNGFMIFENDIIALSLISGQKTYTIGIGGDFNFARPVKINSAKFLSNNTEQDIEIITESEWSDISNKDSSSNMPLKVYYNESSPLGELNFWPKPNTSLTVNLYISTPVEKFTNLDATISLPPGYENLLVYSTADQIAPEYGAELTQRQLQILIETKADIMRKNTKPEYMSCDLTGAESANGGFDVMSGGYI